MDIASAKGDGGMKWFRFYSEALHDPKVQRLSPALFKAWVNLLCLANDQSERGTLPPEKDIAFALRVNQGKARSMVSELKAAGLLDDDGEHVRPHGWDKRQPGSDNAAERMANKRRTSSEHPPNMFAPEQNRGDQNRTEGEGEGEGEQREKPPADVAEIRDLVLSKLSARFQRDPVTWEEAEQFGWDFRGRFSDVGHAIAEFRRNEQGAPFPQKLRPYMPADEVEERKRKYLGGGGFERLRVAE